MSSVEVDERLQLVLPLIQKPCDVFELVAALHMNKDPDVQELLCSKLYEAKSHEIEFFLPQLCNIVLNRTDQETRPLMNFIIDKCRMSLHLGLLVHFIFQGAVEDQQAPPGQPETPTYLRCKSFLDRCRVATINSGKDREMANIIRLFTNYQLQKGRKRVGTSSGASSPIVRVDSPIRRLPTQTKPATISNQPSFASSSSSSLLSSSSSVTQPSSNLSENIIVPKPVRNRLESQTGSDILLSSTYGSKAPHTISAIPISGSSNALNPSGGSNDDLVGSLENSFIELPIDDNDPSFGELDPAEIDDLIPQKPTHEAVLSNDEFSEATYHALIHSFMGTLGDNPKQYDLLLDMDVNMSQFDDTLDATAHYSNFAVLSDLVMKLANSLPSFDIQDPEQTQSQITSLNTSLLELEKVYVAVGSNKPASHSSADQTSDDRKAQNEAFCASLDKEMILKKYRQRYFRSQLHFVSALTGISSLLKSRGFKTKEAKTRALRICLQEFNTEFSRGVYVPILRRSGKTYRVIRIPFKEAFTLNSRDRVPYMIYIEVVSGDEQEEMADLLLGRSSQTDDDKGLTTQSPVVSIRDSEDQKVTKTLQKIEIIDEWVYVDKNAVAAEPPTIIDRIYGESWAKKAQRVKKSSPVGNRKNWELISVVMKSGDDLRQEQLATQLIRVFHDIFQRSGTNLWVYPYEVLAVSSEGGFIETIPDAISIHSIKEELGNDPSLRNYFRQAYGDNSTKYKQAQLNFVESLAAYSLICYLLQIKDRHNGNILLDREGHVIHIDYGFMLTSSPGSLGFESAPFKLTLELIEVMDGKSSAMYQYFKTLFQSGFLAVRKHYKSIISLVEMMESGSKMACFGKGPQTMKLLEDRFKIGLNEEEAIEYANQLITVSEGNWRTDSYDTFQYMTNGIKV